MKEILRLSLFSVVVFAQHALLPEQIADLRREFIRIDTTQRGEITFGDLRSTLEQHGSFSEADLNIIFEGVDFDHTGTISYHEFLAATIRFYGISYCCFIFEKNVSISDNIFR